MYTKEWSLAIIRGIDNTLEKILRETRAEMVSLNLAPHVMTEHCKATRMHAELVYWFKGLHHICPRVYCLLPRRHRRSRRR